MPARPQAQLSIGALAAATGIPADTLRTWERRYGFPIARRKPSGHRLYPLDMVPRLRLISRAIARGHRTAEVVTASEENLEALLAALPIPSAGPHAVLASSATDRPPADVAELLEATRGFDPDRLTRSLGLDWARFGPLEFLERRASPYLAALGSGWAEGSLDVRHEHFGSAVLGDFLRSVRMPIDERADGPLVVLTTLPGELHGLGLQMAAIVFATDDWRTLVLGVETPVPQIAALVREAPVAAVALSIAKPSRLARASLGTLRRHLPRNVRLLVGGSGASGLALPRGATPFADLAALDRWARAHHD